MFRPSSTSCIDIQLVIEQFPGHFLDNILAIHALSGCDTVSSLAGIGKNKLPKLILKASDASSDNELLFKSLSMFSESNIDRESLKLCGRKIFSQLYGSSSKNSVTYQDLRIW